MGVSRKAQRVVIMASSLKPDGCMVITGWTQSFLHPAMIARAGLKVVRGSISSEETQGKLESAFSRFHLFVLEKEGRKKCSSEDDSMYHSLRRRMFGIANA